MVLTNSGSLFQNQSLLNEDGSIKERWAQQGSELVNTYTYLSSSTTVRTTTANKTLFVSQITVQKVSGVSAINFMDGGAGGSQRLRADFANWAAGDVVVYNFAVPLAFSTDLYLSIGVLTAIITITGWEE